MATLAERCKKAGLTSAAELTRITGTSKETLTNWMKDKPQLFEIVLLGAITSKLDALTPAGIKPAAEHNANIV